MRGRVCVITGATRGIGRAVAHGVARLGATTVLLARDRSRGEEAASEVRRTSSGEVALVVCDLASFASIRRAADEIGRRWPALHALVNNAGVSLARRATSADGHEMTFAVNHLAPFLLTHLLLPRLRAADSARIITVSSELERFGRLGLDDLESRRRYNGTRAYLQSKLANVLFTYGLAARLGEGPVVASCVFPGLVATDLLRDHWWWRARALTPVWRRIFRSPAEGADTAVWLAGAADAGRISGRCFKDRGPVRTSRRSQNVSLRDELWKISEEITAAHLAPRVANSAGPEGARQ